MQSLCSPSPGWTLRLRRSSSTMQSSAVINGDNESETIPQTAEEQANDGRIWQPCGKLKCTEPSRTRGEVCCEL